MLKSGLYDNTYRYILFKVTKSALAAGHGNNNKEVIFKNCSTFIYCISERNIIQIFNAKNIYVVTSMYYLVEYKGNCWKTFGSLWQ